MTEDNAVRKIINKNINWSGVVTVPVLGWKPNIYARVEKLEPTIAWQKNVLQLNVDIKLFVVHDEENEQELNEHSDEKKIYTNIIQVSGYVNMHHNMTTKDIQYVNHKLIVEKAANRPGQVYVKGVVELEIGYIARATLMGAVKEFLTNSPIRDALISVQELEHGETMFTATTGSEGKYNFSDIKAGTFRVVASAEGYEPKDSIAVVMLHDKVDFVLHREV
ncbi:hypothetical protein Dtox_3331 [Desulfofarcimen acetoxidans DSM 771]|jgi:hypothetical protein|uniref:Carboxypeptidase regulatory-like domain-containing protein n=1 Tax=Desulfofarcimen acetoxidans (strain ATCC 49208 / DSM 771 / KCTC 5769 / VKM B-1644 / 5575) TaxID=485916 RepID=C8W5R2_DESAS|nr:carboxypeptidase-like regulatory domain-containing protein [Desulfofarcimen acetoxidans]ACV64062.1 hypothetical protein Dtox_3331 [Desulfofarcimen acetoxidans DSM 771]